MEKDHIRAKKSNGGKLALLYTMKYLMEETDEEHAVNATQIAAYLREHDLTADRRTTYANVEVLREFGLDIIQKEGSTGGYFVGARDFELPELKLLVDAVQSSKFITVRKSEQLIRKLSQCTSREQARALKREVFIRNRVKTVNESIFYNVDSIYEAMHQDEQISFQYGVIGLDKKLKVKKGGARYVVSPWALTWDDENYYLVAYDEAADKIKHYRVDKMLKVRSTGESRIGGETYGNFDLAEFARKTFGMYGGEDASITLRCQNALAGLIVDRFGKNVILSPDGEDHFQVTVTVSLSPQFFGWITGIGTGMEILSPAWIRKEYRDYLREIMSKY